MPFPSRFRKGLQISVQTRSLPVGAPPPRTPLTCSSRYLTRIHDAKGIDCTLDRTHHLERRTYLLPQETHFTLADAVLARASAIHGDCVLGQARYEVFRRAQPLRVVGVDQDAQVKVAIAGVSHKGRQELQSR